MSPRRVHSQIHQAIRIFLCYVLILTSLPSPNSAQPSAPVANQDDKKVQSRPETPHKDLPAPKDLMDEGKGLKAKAKEKDTPPKLPRACRYRDVNCLLKANPKDNKIGANPPAAPSPNSSQVTSTAPKSEGNWFKRMGQKLSGALSGASVSALVNPSSTGNSFLPAPATSPAAAPPPPPSFASLNEARIDPRYRIGTGGEDLFSGNYHWSVPLVNLPGRGGLDLNLSLHYNSLQWVRYGDTMYYDPDSYVTLPTGLTTGFNLGFPEIEAGYSYDGVSSYVVMLPSGYRVPMQRVISGSNAKYEAVDGSYLYLTVSSTSRILSMPDGTQYSYDAYSSVSSSYRCSQVKDSNGNRINIAYNTYGISTITDTLGRVLTFTYEPNYGYLYQITQNWMGQPRVIAQFDYDWRTLNYNFGSLSVDAPASNSQVWMLTRVITSDRARHVFVYNDWGIVDDIFLYGALDNQRAALDYVFPASTAALSDAPRFSERNDGIWGFSGQWNTNLGWVANSFQFDPNETWGKVRTPDGVVHVQQFSASGNTRGLATGMETWTGTSNWQGGVRRKWTTTTWQNDGTNRPIYPRVTETNIYDDADGNGTADNRRRATMAYTTFSKTTAQSTMPYTVHLPSQSTEYAADASTVYRTSQTDYLDSTDYWTRWIVGLPMAQRLYQGTSVLQAQTTHSYDDFQALTHPTTINQHDTANYGSNFYPRGNRTSTRRYNISNLASSTETQTEYHVTGNVAKARDALGHETKFFYDDVFAYYTDNGGNTETETTYNLTTKSWAYPTRVEDPDYNSSHIKYWYDTGAPTRTTDPKGAAAISIYETAYGHLTKSKNLVNNAYTRYDYDTGQTWVQVWSTINDMTESAVLRLLDGAGRERQRVDEHPGSSGTLSSSYRIYDWVGRVVEWSNPTEISSNTWLPVGDDAAYIYSRQDYDWNHRPTITYNQDYNASTNPNSKRTISYAGCGCAGGAITTVTDEMGRAKKSYADFLGRAYKTEVMNGASVYLSVQSTFNVRDQVTNVTEYAGAVGSGNATQQTTMEYDGYGRLCKSRKPIETADNIYQYNADDTVYTMQDARGAVTTYGYNPRRLLTSVSYAQGSSGAIATNGVTFQYNELGQRTVMDDGPGYVNYNYDQQGRMTSEVRTFDMAGAPTTPFTITYGEYNLAGQLKKIKDPFNDEIGNSYDKVGRLLTVTGTTAFAGVTSYQNTLSYRAFGGIKTGRTYDSRMRVKTFGNTTYSYDLSSKLTYAQMTSGDPYHQSFSYDHAGRLTGVTTPEIDAPSQFIWTQSSPPNGLYPNYKIRAFEEGISYDEFGNVTQRNNKYWFDWQATGHPTQSFQTTYLNNRANKDNVAGRVQNNQQETWAYNNSGDITNDSRNTMQYDVAGRQVKTQSVSNANIYANSTYDGDGRPVKYDQKRADGSTEVRYRLYSTVLGKLLTDVSPAGQKLETRVYGVANANVRQVKAYTVNSNSYPDTIASESSDPHGTYATLWDRDSNSYKTTHTTPGGTPIESINFQLLRDRFVNGIAAYVSYAQTASNRYSSSYSSLSDPQNPGSGCQLDGQSVSCAKLIREARHGRTDNEYIYHVAGGISGNGYGGGYGVDEEGNQTADLIDGGDINGDLIVRIGYLGEDTPKGKDNPTCYVTLGATWASTDMQERFLHTYIVTSDTKANSSLYFAGFPGGSPLSGAPIYVNAGKEYSEKNSEDYSKKKVAATTYAFEGSCEEINNSLNDTANKINKGQIPYRLGATNSNGVAYTLLKYAGFNTRSFMNELRKQLTWSQRTPGWGTDVLTFKPDPRPLPDPVYIGIH